MERFRQVISGIGDDTLWDRNRHLLPEGKKSSGRDEEEKGQGNEKRGRNVERDLAGIQLSSTEIFFLYQGQLRVTFLPPD